MVVIGCGVVVVAVIKVDVVVVGGCVVGGCCGWLWVVGGGGSNSTCM